MGNCTSAGGGKGGTNIGEKGQPVITYVSPSEKEIMYNDITNQFFNNYQTYGADGEKANKMIIEGFLKDGLIDEEMANKLKKTEAKVKILESRAQVGKSQQKSETQSKKKEESAGGLGMNPGYTSVTSTYKRFRARQRKKFDEWWKGNHK